MIQESLSVIIPVRNEADNIGELVERTKTILSAYHHELIVVDDGSTDKSAQISRDAGARVISNSHNMGKGFAMQRGAHDASGDILVFIDGDSAHRPEEIVNLIKPILEKKADFVIGSKLQPGVKYNSAAPFTRKVASYLASMVMSIIVSIPLPLATKLKCPLKWVRIHDCTSGYRAIRKVSWEKLELRSRGFEIEIEVIYEAVKNRLRIAEVPISFVWTTKGSHLSMMKDGFKTLGLLGKNLLRDTSRF